MGQHRVLLLGSSGQMGQAMQHLIAQKQIPATWDMTLIARTKCDVTNPAQLRHILQEAKPQLVINVAALTHLEFAQKNENAAMAVNFHAVAQLAGQCSMMDIPIIHLSTNYVFDGRENRPYTTEDKMNPLNVFGGSKMLGEEALRDQHPWHVILRAGSLFSPFRRNILTAALRMIENHDEIRIPTDLITSPTYAVDVARAMVTIGEELLAGSSTGYGTFHLAGTPETSRFDFFEAIMKTYEPLTTRRPKLIPTMYAECDVSVRRPAYAVLDSSKAERVYGIKPRPWQEGLTESIDLLHRGGRTPRLPR